MRRLAERYTAAGLYDDEGKPIRGAELLPDSAGEISEEWLRRFGQRPKTDRTTSEPESREDRDERWIHLGGEEWDLWNRSWDNHAPGEDLREIDRMMQLNRGSSAATEDDHDSEMDKDRLAHFLRTGGWQIDDGPTGNPVGRPQQEGLEETFHGELMRRWRDPNESIARYFTPAANATAERHGIKGATVLKRPYLRELKTEETELRKALAQTLALDGWRRLSRADLARAHDTTTRQIRRDAAERPLSPAVPQMLAVLSGRQKELPVTTTYAEELSDATRLQEIALDLAGIAQRIEERLPEDERARAWCRSLRLVESDCRVA